MHAISCLSTVSIHGAPRPQKPEGLLNVRDGEKGEWIWRWGKSRHQNDSCIKVGSNGSHFNVSVGSDGQSHNAVSTNHKHFEEKGEPKQY